jgi:predicted permease
MMGLSLVLLLITSASVTNLLMARAGSRRRELAVRAALGARLGRVVRQLLTEAVVLALMAAVAAVPIVVTVTNAFRELIASASAVTNLDPDFRVDLRVLAVTFAIAVCAGLVAGAAPAAAACRADLTGSLKNGNGAMRGARQRWRLAASSPGYMRTTLVVVQVALALALLVSGGLFMRSLERARNVDLGFDPNDLILASTTPGIAGLDRPRRLAFYHAVRDRVAALPGVETAGWISFPPLGIIGEVATVSPDERRQDVDWRPPPVALADVSGEYFATARMPVIEGRVFDDRDGAAAKPVVIVNDTLARQFWPNRSPIGRRLAIRDATLEVVGVVRTGKYQMVWESPRGAVFRPLAQAVPSRATLTVRFSREAPDLGLGVQRIVRDVNPDVAVYDVRSMIEHLDSGSAFLPFRMGALISSVFGGLGLLLASIALYGMVAYHVGQQAREFGIRMALGARRSDIIGDVLARAGRLALLGVAVGVALASGLSHMLRALLVGVSPFDPATHASVAGLLVGICLLASFVPAWRAAIRDPLVALRSE